MVATTWWTIAHIYGISFNSRKKRLNRIGGESNKQVVSYIWFFGFNKIGSAFLLFSLSRALFITDHILRLDTSA